MDYMKGNAKEDTNAEARFPMLLYLHTLFLLYSYIFYMGFYVCFNILLT